MNTNPNVFKQIFSIIFCLFLTLTSFSQETVSTALGDFPVGMMTPWVVPDNVYSITVEAVGGGGGDAAANGSLPGGNGAVVTAIFDVVPGETLNIIVGEKGGTGSETGGDGGGGGGTAIINSANTILIVAGAGGGARGAASNDLAGGNGIAAQGVLGLGGSGNSGGGGGGAAGNGANGIDCGGGGAGAIANLNGANGGTAGINGGAAGGFGFGGGGGSNNAAGGGGGGATGGNGGYYVAGTDTYFPSTGGQSYVTASALGTAVFDNTMENIEGSVTIMFEPIAVPTMGQWGIIILGLIMFAVGISVIRERKSILAFVKG